MRTIGLVMVVSLVAACRIGFSAQPDGQPAEPVVDAPPDAPPPVLACGAATKFPMLKAPLQIAATATADGYNLITSDGSSVRGFAYSFAGDALTPVRGDVPLFTGNVGAIGEIGEITTIAKGDHTLLGVTTAPPVLSVAPFPGAPTYDTTTLIALDAQLAMAAQPATHSGWVGGVGSLARSASGTLALLGTQVPASEIAVRTIAPDGTASGPPHAVVLDGDSATVVPAGDELLVVWNAYSSVSETIRVFASLHTLSANSFVTRVFETPVSTTQNANAYNARAAHSEATGTSLIAWMDKSGTGDHIWISLRDRNLVDIVTKDIGLGNLPIVVAGAQDYLVVWRMDTLHLGGARISPDGTVRAVTIESTAREVLGVDLVVRAGQPALVWIENGTAGAATARFDPLCVP